MRYGNEHQQREWLVPLLEGNIRSGFAMTEPHVASSDATNIECSIQRWMIKGFNFFNFLSGRSVNFFSDKGLPFL